MRGWGRDGLGTGARGRGREGAEGVDVDHALEARRAEVRRRGRCPGIGVASYIELNTGFPRERAQITVRPEGAVDVVLGTLSSGQGHMTSFAELLVEWLGWSCPRRISSPGIPTSPSAAARTPPARCGWRLS